MDNELKREQLIDRVLDKDPMIFIDDIEEKIIELSNNLKYFDLKLSNLYFK